VGVQEVRWDTGGTIKARDYNFFYGKEKKIINWEKDVLCTTQ
jgi:3D (Asp-Asp-Asp) domain-containing protein